MSNQTFLKTKSIKQWQKQHPAFGSVMQTRSFSSVAYRFGFNNQEKDGELGEVYAFEYRMHDARLGRFLSVDPLSPKFPWYSPYHFGSNSPIMAIELEGLESSSTGTNGTENAGNVKSASYCDGSNLGGYLDILGNDIILPPAATAIVNVYAHFTLTCYGKPDMDKGDHPIVKSFNDGEGHTYNWSQTKKNYESECGDIFPKVTPLDPNASNQGQSMSIWQDGSENSEEQKSYSHWWDDGFSDPCNTAPDATGAVLQVDFTVFGQTFSPFIGMSKKDGFNLGLIRSNGQYSLMNNGLGFSAHAASGDFSWNNFQGEGKGYSAGFGPVAYCYSEGGFDVVDKPKYRTNGLGFSFRSNPWKFMPKSLKNLNGSLGETNTFLLFK